MTVTIIGSMSKSRGDMKAVQTLMESLKIFVHSPIDNNTDENEPLVEKQLRYLECIEDADIVILVLKPDLTIGESTSYELAYARHIHKPIVTYGAIAAGGSYIWAN